MLRVGIIAEGKSDWLVLEAMMRKLHPDIAFLRLRPDLTLASMSPHGWKGVRAWCREFGPKLETFMKGIKGQELDLLVIHTDCSMAHNEGAERPCPPSSDTANALREILVTKWLGLPERPRFVIVTNPSKSTDAWVVAALEPPYRHLATIECAPGVEGELVSRRLLRKKDGEVKKPEVRYTPLAAEVVRRLPQVLTHCTQANRFVEEFRSALVAVTTRPGLSAPGGPPLGG